MNVIVSLLDRQYYRESKDAERIAYGPGDTVMPLEHVQAMGLLRRVRGYAGDKVEEGAQPLAIPFDGAFDDKLTRVLEGAGYSTLDDLRGLSQDQLFAIEGIGPANYERIQNALKGA